jgi:hypothetical protein
MKNFSLIIIIVWLPCISYAESLALQLARSTNVEALQKTYRSEQQEQVLNITCFIEWIEQRIPYHCFSYLQAQHTDEVKFSNGDTVSKAEIFERCKWAAEHNPENYIYSKRDLLPASCQARAEKSYQIQLYKQNGYFIGTKNVN